MREPSVPDPKAYFAEVKRAAARIRRRAPKGAAEIGVVLGSGLASAAPSLTRETAVPYDRIPGFPKPTVKGHSGRLALGSRGGRGVAVLEGRLHYYEGHSMGRVVFPLHVLV